MTGLPKGIGKRGRPANRLSKSDVERIFGLASQFNAYGITIHASGDITVRLCEYERVVSTNPNWAFSGEDREEDEWEGEAGE